MALTVPDTLSIYQLFLLAISYDTAGVNVEGVVRGDGTSAHWWKRRLGIVFFYVVKKAWLVSG